MSLNWKEINLILEELELPGMKIQKAVQSAFEVLSLKLYGKNGAKTLLISLSSTACRIHETFNSVPKSNKPLRFSQFLNSRLINGRIEEALQLGNDRIIRLTVRCNPEGQGEEFFRMYIRLWSNAANVIVTDMDGQVLDAMRRIPAKKEVSGGFYMPDEAATDNTEGKKPVKDLNIREFSEELLSDLPPEASFNQKIDTFYSKEGGTLSLKALQEEVKRKFEEKINKLSVSLERLKEKEADSAGAERFKDYGDLILSNMVLIRPGAEWLEVDGPDGKIQIKLDPQKNPILCAKDYYEQYRKAKSGTDEIKDQIEKDEKQLLKLEETLKSLLSETNPLVLHKLLKRDGKSPSPASKTDEKRPGLSFRRKEWLILVGRSAAENETLLRKYIRGNDFWLHTRDFAGSYVFIKNIPGKTVPLDILLDAGNLALFYSKGRDNGAGDIFYTQAKNLRRIKGGPLGKVLPTQEKNLHIKLDAARLKELEECKVRSEK